MKTPNVVLVGHVCIDHNTTESATYTSWGSTVLYIAQYLQSAQDITPVIISNYGPDILPYLPGVHIVPAEPNQTQTLVYENDTRTTPRIWKAHNTTFAEAPKLTPEVIEAVQAADIILVGTLLPNYSAEYIQELLGYAPPTALRVLCPQGYFRHIADDGLVIPRDFSEAPQIVPLFDLVVYSEEDHPQAFAIAKAWTQYNDATKIIITEGEKGASIVAKNGIVAIPTTPLAPEDIVDSVGCGDIFDATVTYAYYQSKDLEQAVQAAHVAAGKKLSGLAGIKK
jgi:sugar/nucleoside kinase (ribokinase family)